MKKTVFSCSSVSVRADQTEILNKLSLTINSGELHLLMGPNGSGKSTFAHALAGNPQFALTAGQLFFDETNITDLSSHERAKLGIFLSHQNPPAIPGLTVFNLLKESFHALCDDQMPAELLHALAVTHCKRLKLDSSFLDRSCNDGFSGGERKRFELLQIMMIKPKLLILDEIDSGLDIDGLKLVGEIISCLKKENPTMAILMITHYQQILDYVMPDKVHLLSAGQIVRTGDNSLISKVMQQGYHEYLTTDQA